MLLIDTIDVGAEGTPVYQSVISSGEIIKCFLLGIPCVLKTETEAEGDTKTASMSQILSVNYGGEAAYITTAVNGNIFVAQVLDPEDPATFEAD